MTNPADLTPSQSGSAGETPPPNQPGNTIRPGGDLVIDAAASGRKSTQVQSPMNAPGSSGSSTITRGEPALSARAAGLVGRAGLIGTVPLDARANAEADRNKPRLDEFSSVLNAARSVSPALQGNDLKEVFRALLSQIGSLGSSGHEGYELMLESVESLGHTWNKAAATPDAQLDQGKHDILHLLFNAPIVSSFNDSQKDGYFDRLCGVLASIRTPRIKSQSVAGMPLGRWYLSSTTAIEFGRFNRIAEFVESSKDELDDASKSEAVCKLWPMLSRAQRVTHAHTERVLEYFECLYRITLSITNDRKKGDAVIGLKEAHCWLPVGAARVYGDDLIEALTNSIGDPRIKAEVEAVENR